MNDATHLEHRASSSRGKHEGESSLGLCDRLDRTRDNSQRQLPTDHDYAVPTREYQTDQSSPFLPRLLLALSSGKAKAKTKTTPLLRRVDTVTPYQAKALTIPERECIEPEMFRRVLQSGDIPLELTTVANSFAPAS